MYSFLKFENKRFGDMEVIVDKERILFSDSFLRKCLDVRNKEIPNCSNTYTENDSWVELFEVFEYIRYAKCDEEIRNLFEEWLADVIKDCSKF